jgi:hypothetical protein
MPKRVKFHATNELKLYGITGFIKRRGVERRGGVNVGR